MPDTSATGGYLTLSADSYDLNHVVHDFIMGLTAIDKTLIRPMYQPNAPVVPSFGTNWIAFNVKEADSEGFASQELKTSYSMKRSAQLIVTISFYGSSAYQNIKSFKDSLEITQNWEAVRTYGMAFGGSGNIIKIPELHNMRWLDRYNIEIIINQMTTKTPSIISLEKVSTIKTVNTSIVINR